MMSSKISIRSLPGTRVDVRSPPVLRPAAPGRATLLHVRAASGGPPSLPGAGRSTRPDIKLRSSSYPRGTGQTSGGGGPVIGGPGGPGVGGAGAGGAGYRPVGTGGPGGPSGGGPKLPRGWSWDRVLLTLLGIALAVPAWKYVNRRYIMKPEPEHTLAVAEDKAAEIKGKGTVSKLTSSLKQATVEPVRDVVGAGVQAVKHSDTLRTVQHKGEDLKDTVDVDLHEAKAKADARAHEAKVKAQRAAERAKEKVSDVVYDTEKATGKTTKGVLENIKGAAHTVGRKLHVVADSSEKGLKKAADKAERAIGVKTTGLPSTSAEQRKKVYAISAGAAVGTGVLAAALYYWDRKGGDLKGKVRKLQDRTKEAADKALHRTKDAAAAAAEPARPPAGHL